MAHAVTDTIWVCQLLLELHRPIEQTTIVYCDNISDVYMSENPVQRRQTKHIEIYIHFVREKVALGQVRVLHVPTMAQFADIFTKGLATKSFQVHSQRHGASRLILWGDVRLFLGSQVS